MPLRNIRVFPPRSLRYEQTREAIKRVANRVASICSQARLSWPIAAFRLARELVREFLILCFRFKPDHRNSPARRASFFVSLDVVTSPRP